MKLKHNMIFFVISKLKAPVHFPEIPCICIFTVSWNKDHGGAGYICGTVLYMYSVTQWRLQGGGQGGSRPPLTDSGGGNAPSLRF